MEMPLICLAWVFKIPVDATKYGFIFSDYRYSSDFNLLQLFTENSFHPVEEISWLQQITSRGGGTSLDFALKLVELLYSMDKVKEVSQGLALVD